MRHVKGRVLDIGCGAGRHSLHLQEKGQDVVGIDQSPLAIQVCRARGINDARLLATTQIDSSLGAFDTFLMLGGNFGLVGSIDGARRLLSRLDRVASDHARILANASDPYYPPADPYWLEHHEVNRQKGRMAGQNRMRVRYLGFTTPWFDWLLVSRDEMESILRGTGWTVKRYIGGDTRTYVAVIEKE
jgi:SAM-dependent methyltransferase